VKSIADALLYMIQKAMLAALCGIILLALAVAVSMAFDGGYSGP